ncbi:uncharacterized protein BO88DRAFT_410178 [Aspergillus vadensis CBS 113365]|uniref:Uncharacterized protein n=1 Tax=Aspergillus vadensis (strain CBS 113365 / IMI 142717 / IBT 24658) TaxID=1448311 RepID=A0A319CHP8_ASPVC|nr:hypothetical protein BO88DRAFT_410178 [Aspergillus vadensis CBS 113365]PYH74848.1 hypothetical protein BO88DRAFT_410178 [Aspergillus vadensis CBS 113365]
MRRGRSAEKCRYMGNPRLDTEQTTTPQPEEQKHLLAQSSDQEQLRQRQAQEQARGAVAPKNAPTATDSSTDTRQNKPTRYARQLPNPKNANKPQLNHNRTRTKPPSGHTEKKHHSDDPQIPEAKSALSKEHRSQAQNKGYEQVRSPARATKERITAAQSPVNPEEHSEPETERPHTPHERKLEPEDQQLGQEASSVTTACIPQSLANRGMHATDHNQDEPAPEDGAQENTVTKNNKTLAAHDRDAALHEQDAKDDQ